jgi:hypothetical protein
MPWIMATVAGGTQMQDTYHYQIMRRAIEEIDAAEQPLSLRHWQAA